MSLKKFVLVLSSDMVTAGDGSVVVDSLFIVAAIVSLGFCVCHDFVMHYIVPSLLLQSTRYGRESWLLYFYCLLKS